MKTPRPLTASLHTVTAVTRVACRLAKLEPSLSAASPELLTADALAVLGYTDEADTVAATISRSADLPPLLAACLASVAKAVSL